MGLYFQAESQVTVDANGEIVVGASDKQHSFPVYWDSAAPGAGTYDATASMQAKSVQLSTGHTFRDPPVFKEHAKVGDKQRAAHDEVDELLDHLFNRPTRPSTSQHA